MPGLLLFLGLVLDDDTLPDVVRDTSSLNASLGGPGTVLMFEAAAFGLLLLLLELEESDKIGSP